MTEKKKSIRSMTKSELAAEIYDLNKKNGYKNPFSRKKAIDIMCNSTGEAAGFTKAELQEIVEQLRRRQAKQAIGASPVARTKPTLPKGYKNSAVKAVTQADLNQSAQNFSEVRKKIPSGEARNIAFKKPMSFYREHSVDEAIAILMKEANSKVKK